MTPPPFTRFKKPLATAAATLFVLVVVSALSACSRDEPKPTAAPVSIEPVEGMKYYVGGPLMKADQYGRYRISGFNGEISAPTTRGLLLGAKLDGNRFEYRTWINGKLISRSTGFVDDNGLYWYEERFTYHFNGNAIAHQLLRYDDDRKVMLSTLEQLDPETGEVVRTHETEIPYTPVDDGPDDWDDDEDEDDEEDEEPAKSEPRGSGGDAEGRLTPIRPSLSWRLG